MSAETPLLVHRWKVGRHTASLSIPRADRGAVAAAVIEWDPTVPTRLTEGELAEYRAGRAVAMAELSRLLGGTVACIEL